MNNRERTLAILNYQPYDRLPLVHFGFWTETLEKWAQEGHLTFDQASDWADGNEMDAVITRQLGFDFNWAFALSPQTGLFPRFEKVVYETYPDGRQKVLDENGAIVYEKLNTPSIPEEIDHLLKDRASWREHFLPRLQFQAERLADALNEAAAGLVDGLPRAERQRPQGLYLGSFFGDIRTWLGVVGMSYLLADDPDLLVEIIETTGDLNFRMAQAILEVSPDFDYAHIWEDICFKNGPLVNPRFFAQHVGPQYRRVTDLLHQHGIHIVSLDCDGKIDKLVPIWVENGVNTMFPIEVGVWQADIRPWRAQFGRELRGVGGMNKVVFSQDRAAVDAEVERLRALVDLGGFIPCPDHRLPPDAEWDNVLYYCERMHQVFG